MEPSARRFRHVRLEEEAVSPVRQWLDTLSQMAMFMLAAILFLRLFFELSRLPARLCCQTIMRETVW